jgi:hypothetical protein
MRRRACLAGLRHVRMPAAATNTITTDITSAKRAPRARLHTPRTLRHCHSARSDTLWESYSRVWHEGTPADHYSLPDERAHPPSRPSPEARHLEAGRMSAFFGVPLLAPSLGFVPLAFRARREIIPAARYPASASSSAASCASFRALPGAPWTAENPVRLPQRLDDVLSLGKPRAQCQREGFPHCL